MAGTDWESRRGSDKQDCERIRMKSETMFDILDASISIRERGKVSPPESDDLYDPSGRSKISTTKYRPGMVWMELWRFQSSDSSKAWA